MSQAAEFQRVFCRLREILGAHAEHLSCVRDADGDYHLDTAHIMKNRKPLFFGAAQIRKNYVSYHLMPVYVFPHLLDAISPELRRRMQGKSCFNFTSVDAALFDELSALTRAGYEEYRSAGYVEMLES